MGNLSSFLMENAEVIENKKVIISRKFKNEKGEPTPFEIKALTAKEVSKLRKSCTKRVKGKNGYTDETDEELLGVKIAVESVVFPDLKSEELQSSYNVMGAEELLQTMLTIGEFHTLSRAVTELSGNDLDMDELVEEAKN